MSNKLSEEQRKQLSRGIAEIALRAAIGVFAEKKSVSNKLSERMQITDPKRRHVRRSSKPWVFLERRSEAQRVRPFTYFTDNSKP